MDLTTLFTMTYGVYVLSTKCEDEINACIINTAIQVTQEPPRISITVLKSNYTHDLVMKSGQFNVSVAGEQTPLQVIERFGFKSGRDTNKFSDFDYEVDSLGNPVISKECIANISCKVISSIDLGSHTMFIADVIEAKNLNSGKAMTYAYYRDLKMGKIVQTNLTTIEEDDSAKKKNNDVYQCSICHYVYDGEIPFEELGDDYVCPLCNQPKSVFIKK